MRSDFSGPAHSCLVRATRQRAHAKIGSLRQAAVRLKPAQLQQVLVASRTKALGYHNRAQPSCNICPAGSTCTPSSARNPSRSSSSFQPIPALPRLASSIVVIQALRLPSSIKSSAPAAGVHRLSAYTACQARLLSSAWCRPAYRSCMANAVSTALPSGGMPGLPDRGPHFLSTNAGTMAGPSAASQRLGGRCNGYVGEGTAPAGEYHHADFSWEDHCREVLTLIASDPVKWRHLAHDSLPDSSPSSYPLSTHQDPQDSSRAVGAETQQLQPSGGPHSESPCDETQDPQPSAGLQSSSPTIKAQDAQQPSGVQSSSKGRTDEAARPDGAKAGADSAARNREGSRPVPSGPADLRPAPVSSRKQAWGIAAATIILPEARHQEYQLDARQPSVPGHAVSGAHSAGQTTDGRPQLQAEHDPATGLGSQRRARVPADDGKEGGGSKGYSSSRWEAFHAQDNRSGRFYKERRWAPGAAAGD